MIECRFFGTSGFGFLWFTVRSDRRDLTRAFTLHVRKSQLTPAVWLEYRQLSIKIHLKAPRQGYLLATMLTSQTSVLPFLPEPLMEETPAHMDSQMARKMWTEWLVHFTKRSGGTLATFTVVELIASISFFFAYVRSLLALCRHGVF